MEKMEECFKIVPPDEMTPEIIRQSTTILQKPKYSCPYVNKCFKKVRAKTRPKSAVGSRISSKLINNSPIPKKKQLTDYSKISESETSSTTRHDIEKRFNGRVKIHTAFNETIMITLQKEEDNKVACTLTNSKTQQTQPEEKDNSEKIMQEINKLLEVNSKNLLSIDDRLNSFSTGIKKNKQEENTEIATQEIARSSLGAPSPHSQEDPALQNSLTQTMKSIQELYFDYLSPEKGDCNLKEWPHPIQEQIKKKRSSRKDYSLTPAYKLLDVAPHVLKNKSHQTKKLLDMLSKKRETQEKNYMESINRIRSSKKPETTRPGYHSEKSSIRTQVITSFQPRTVHRPQRASTALSKYPKKFQTLNRTGSQKSQFQNNNSFQNHLNLSASINCKKGKYLLLNHPVKDEYLSEQKIKINEESLPLEEAEFFDENEELMKVIQNYKNKTIRFRKDSTESSSPIIINGVAVPNIQPQRCIIIPQSCAVSKNIKTMSSSSFLHNQRGGSIRKRNAPIYRRTTAFERMIQHKNPFMLIRNIKPECNTSQEKKISAQATLNYSQRKLNEKKFLSSTGKISRFTTNPRSRMLRNSSTTSRHFQYC